MNINKIKGLFCHVLFNAILPLVNDAFLKLNVNEFPVIAAPFLESLQDEFTIIGSAPRISIPSIV